MVWVFFPLCDFLNSFRSSVKGRLQPDVHVWFVLSPSLLATALKLLHSPESWICSFPHPWCDCTPGSGCFSLSSTSSRRRSMPTKWTSLPLEELANGALGSTTTLSSNSYLSFVFLDLDPPIKLCFLLYNPQHAASGVPLGQSGLWWCPEWDGNREDSFQSFY